MRIMAIKVDMIVFLILLISASSTEVDNLNILLPELKQAPPTLPLQLITAQAGCYDWKSSFPQHLQVNPHLPNKNGCSRQAVISVGKLGSFASTIYVSAVDGASQSALNIPVRIRKISRIVIASKSRMMNIKELQKLQLFGFDADGNTFTSLEGLRFKWQLEQDAQIIQNVLLQNAQLYLPLRTRQNLEKKGYQTDMLVVQAIAPGNLKVRVRCIEPGYETLLDEITISVHQRFQLSPGPVIHMATDTSFQLKLVRPNLEQILLPQPYYRIISCSRFIINQTLYLSVPNYPAKCTIKVEDTRTKPAYQSTIQIVVSDADQLRIITDPLIIVEKQSKYEANLYLKGEPLLGQSRKIVYSSDFTLRKGHKALVASRKGSGYLAAELGQLKKSVIINAFLPVTVLLPEPYIHLPVQEHFKLKILGGTGVYDFQTSKDIASINTLSIIHARQVGETYIVIKDRNYPVNQITLRLKISEIAKIQSLEENKQTNKDQWAYFYVLARSLSSQTFTQCQSAHFSLSVPTTQLDFDPKVNFVESVSFLNFHNSQLVKAAIAPTSLLKGKQSEIIKSFTKYVDQNEIVLQDLKNYIGNLQNYGICKALKFKSIVPFDQRALIALQNQTDIRTVVPLRVYDLIQTRIQDENNIFLMTPDSSLNWTFTGGSYSWPDTATYFSINGKPIPGNTNPIIRCPSKEMSSQIYDLKIYNQQTKSLLFPVSQTTSISLACKYPRKLHLGLEHGLIFDDLYIERETEVKGQVKATDQLGQQFFNSSNVIYQFNSLNGYVTYVDKSFHYRSQGKNDTLSIFTEKLNTGQSFNKVSINIDIYLVEPIAVLHPLVTNKKHASIVTLFTPKKPYILKIRNMHSQLQIECTNHISCEKGDNYIQVKLLRLGKGSLHLRDKKIYGSEDWHFQFIIVQPDEVRVTAHNDYFQEGEIFEVNVTNYFNGDQISAFTYEPTYLGLVIPNSMVIVQQHVQTFRVSAEKFGNYQILGESTYPSIKRSDDPLNITVYKKISINVADLRSRHQNDLHILQASTAIIVGCRKFLTILGGPKQLVSKFIINQTEISMTQLNNRSFQLSSKKEGLYTFVIEISFRKNRISVVHGTVTVNKIQKVQLQTIDQPVVGAHFRINPRFKIGDSNLEEQYCDYSYSWRTFGGLIKLGESLSFGLLDATGINATAVEAGNEIVTFQVKDKNGNLLIKQTKKIEVLQDIVLALPTYINKDKFQAIPASIIMAPNTRHVFSGQIKIKNDQGTVHIGRKDNILQSTKKLGHSTIRLTQPGHRTVQVEVEVKQIMGIFIENKEGFIDIPPNTQTTISIYIQDNFGRLFYTPLENLELQIFSSNSDILQVSLTQEGSLTLKSFKQGVCIVYVKVPSRNILDSIAVSIGTAISPGKSIKISKNGIIKFSTSASQAIWSSENSKIVEISPATGVAHAVGLGKTKIYYGQLSSDVSVLRIAKVQQVGKQVYKGSTLEVQYKFYWQIDNRYEEISNIKSSEAINNNLGLICSVDSSQLTIKGFVKESQGRQSWICQVKLQYSQKWPETFAIKVEDEAHLFEPKQFNYQFTPIFKLYKKSILLSPIRYQSQVIIKSPQPLNVTLRNGKPKWVVDSFYDQRNKLQKILVDMKGQQTGLTWFLDVSLQGQQEQIKIQFKLQGEQEEVHSWMPNLEWPDFLIILMAIVFFVTCYVQKIFEQKIKNT